MISVSRAIIAFSFFIHLYNPFAILTTYTGIIIPYLPRKSNRRYAETSFRSRGDFCYELDEYHKAYKKLIELFPDAHIPKLSKLKTELEKAQTEYAEQSAERKALKKEADRLSRLAQQKRDSQRTLARYMQNEQAAKRKKGQLE